MTKYTRNPSIAAAAARQRGCYTAIGFAALAAASVPAQAWAQEAPADTVSDAGSTDIVVTARKREERLQDVPIAVTAITGAKLAELGVTDITKLDSVTPGMNISQSVGFVSYFVRGVGSNTTIPGVENSIATYIDGVYVARPTAALQRLKNIERVEVLRGPQGTLFGRNATGGLVNIITKQPSSQFEGSAEVSYANADTIEASLYLTGPLSDTLSAGFSVATREQGDGYGTNLLLNTDLYETDYINARAQLKFESGGFTATLAGYYNLTDSTVPGATTIPVGARPATANGGLLLNGTPAGPARFSTRPRTNFANSEPSFRFRDYGGSLTLVNDWDSVTLTSITAYNESIGYITNDFDLTDAQGWLRAFVPGGTNISTPTQGFYGTYAFPYFLSQEIRLESTGSGPFKWLVGVYAQNNKDGYDPIKVFVGPNPVTNWSERSEIALPGYAAAIIGQVKNRAYAGFAQATYSISDQFDLTAGIRYNYEQKDYHGQQYSINAAGVPTLAVERRAKDSWERPTWLLNATYRATDDAMIYASYNRGFRSGVFNTSSATATNPINEEVIDAYEVGVKTQWFDRRLTFNASAYIYDYRDLQFLVVSPTTGTADLINAAAAKIKGIDFDLVARPIDGLNLFANMTLLDAKYTEFPNYIARVPQVDAVGNPIGGAANALVDVMGNRLMLTSPYTLTVGFTASQPLGSGGTMLELSSNLTAKGRYFTNPEHSVKQPAYAMVDASIGVKIPRGKQTISLSLFGRNLTDKDVIVSGSAVFNTLRVTYAEPRTYGVRLGIDF